MRSAKQALHVGGMAGVQHHNQHAQEWDPWKTDPGEWVMPGQAEEEHPARFAWQMAVAISRGTAKKLQFRLGALHIPALQPLVEDNKSCWQTLPSNTVSGFTMVPAGLHFPWCHQASSFATYYHMASSIMVESCDLGETLADEEEALVTCKRLTGKMNERIATLLVSNMRCTTLVNREDPSEAQGDNKIIPAITDLNISSAMSSRMKKPIKAIREAAKVSWDLKRRGTVEDEDAPLPSESKRLGSLLFRRYKPRSSANADAGETVVSRSKRQLNRHCIKCENILKTKTRRGEADEVGVMRTQLGDENELVEREEPKWKQPRTITPKLVLMRSGVTSSTWPEQVSRDFETNPAQPRPMSRRHMTMCRFLWRLQATPTSE